MRVGEELIVLGVGGCASGFVLTRCNANGKHKDR